MKLLKKRLWRTVLAVALILVLFCGEALANVPVYINSNTYVYNRPWTSAASIAVPAGLPCYMQAFQGDWALVYNPVANVSAFIPLSYIRLAQRITAYTAGAAPLYATASTSGPVYGTIPYGTDVYIVGRDGGFFRVQNAQGSIEGYIAMSALTPYKPASRIKGYAIQNTPLYKSASTSSGRILTIPSGTPVYVVGQSGNFFRVQDETAYYNGYVVASTLSQYPPSYTTPAIPSEPSQPTTAPTQQPSIPGVNSSLLSTTSSYYSGMSNAEKLEYVIYMAQNLYGVPYASDANPPYSFDCSRYVRYCFQHAKIDLPHSSQTQGYDGGYAFISNAASLRRGDVVCFNTEAGDNDLSDHTGIYLGDGYFIHASSGGGKVIVSSLVSGYYKDNFSWGRRILG